jgi:hypothetical protein
MTNKLILAIGIALVIVAVGFVSIGAGTIFPLEFGGGPRGGMIESAILVFCGSLVGLYWIVKVYMPTIRKKKVNGRKDERK